MNDMTTDRTVELGDLKIANNRPVVIIAGPCAMESHDHALDMAGSINQITQRLGMGFIYKSSFDKANRTSLNTQRGLGINQALKIFEAVKAEIGCPVITDVHLPDQCQEVATVVDVLQIPAFLCRQTDLLLAAGHTGRVINIKKGQFLAPWDMENVAKKIDSTGNPNSLLCERGTSFGYNRLVTDFRGLSIMAETGRPIVFDATHSVQEPGGMGATSGGQREYVPLLARAAAAIGVAAIFIETHENPEQAPSDGPNMVPLDQLERLLEDIQRFDQMAKSTPLNIH